LAVCTCHNVAAYTLCGFSITYKYILALSLLYAKHAIALNAYHIADLAELWQYEYAKPLLWYRYIEGSMSRT
jgi:hypothetical protein